MVGEDSCRTDVENALNGEPQRKSLLLNSLFSHVRGGFLRWESAENFLIFYSVFLIDGIISTL